MSLLRELNKARTEFCNNAFMTDKDVVRLNKKASKAYEYDMVEYYNVLNELCEAQSKAYKNAFEQFERDHAEEYAKAQEEECALTMAKLRKLPREIRRERYRENGVEGERVFYADGSIMESHPDFLKERR